ncbi:ABC transporter ATP-binding protein (plasmid) [Aggregatilineales bacterium SYSU G02658]
MPLYPDVASTTTNFDVRQTIHPNRLRSMWLLLVGYRPRYVAAVAALGLAGVMNTLSLLLLAYLVDDVLVAQPENFLTLLALIAAVYVGLSIVRGLFAFVSGALAGQVSEAVALRLKDFLFDHIQRLTFSYHDKMPTGELIQRVTSDIDAVRRFFAEQAIGLGRIVLLFLINFSALMLLDWRLTLFSVAVVPVIGVMSLFFFRRVERAYDAFQEQDGVVSATLQENLSGVRVVKAFARQDFEVNRFEKENHKKFDLGKAFMMLHAVYWPVTDTLTGLQMAAGFAVGALMVINDQLTLGVFVTYMAMLGWIINPIRELGRLIVQISTGLVSFDRIASVVRNERELLGEGEPAPVSDLKGSVRFEHVTFAYEDGKPVLHDISFDVPAGQTVALLGSTGSGKTTLMALLTRFYDYTEGSIQLDGVDLREYPRHFLRANIGVVQQEPFLFSRSIRENITYGVQRAVSDEEVYAAARAAAVHDVIMEFPDGYNTIVGEKGVTLSGGQKQRVALARTLLKNPRILILDDATSSVDTHTESEIREALETMMTQRTTFIIAHRIQSVMIADQILVMDKGRIVQRGTHEQLMREDGIYRQTYEMQAQIEAELESELANV